MSRTDASITVRPVTDTRERRIFIRFPWRIYRDDPLWVPPVLREREARLDPSRNPFFQFGEAAFFIAWRDGRPLGTIAPAIDHRANAHLGEKAAVFGFFECVAEYPVAQALLDCAVDWARARGAQVLRGPQSFGPSDEPGLLIEGRETPAGLLMGWSPPYYVEFVERYGFRKWRDSLAYRAYVRDYTDEEGRPRIPDRLQRVAEYAARRYGYRVRMGDMAAWERELETARQIYNRSLATLPDFVPFEAAEWREQAERLRPLLDPQLMVFALVGEEPVGFGLALPDINQALLHCDGLRRPWDYLRLWWYSRRLPGVSFKIMAMLPEYWGRGLDALIYLHIAQAALQRGYQWMDMSLTGEDNPMTNRLALGMGARLDKRYRTYELPLR